jgi:hypothetical protein
MATNSNPTRKKSQAKQLEELRNQVAEQDRRIAEQNELIGVPPNHLPQL